MAPKLVTSTGALRASWAVFMVLLVMFAAVALSIGYAAYEQRQSDRQWCALLRSLDYPLPSSAPATSRQRVIAREIHDLRVSKGC